MNPDTYPQQFSLTDEQRLARFEMRATVGDQAAEVEARRLRDKIARANAQGLVPHDALRCRCPQCSAYALHGAAA